MASRFRGARHFQDSCCVIRVFGVENVTELLGVQDSCCVSLRGETAGDVTELLGGDPLVVVLQVSREFDAVGRKIARSPREAAGSG